MILLCSIALAQWGPGGIPTDWRGYGLEWMESEAFTSALATSFLHMDTDTLTFELVGTSADRDIYFNFQEEDGTKHIFKWNDGASYYQLDGGLNLAGFIQASGAVAAGGGKVIIGEMGSDYGLYTTSSSPILPIDPNSSGAGTIQLGETGDHDVINVVGRFTAVMTALAGGDSVGPLIQLIQHADSTYTGTTAGLVVKNYDATDAVIHGSGENTGLAVFMKQLSSSAAGGENSIMSLHSHASALGKLDHGIVVYPDTVGSGLAFRDAVMDYGLDFNDVGNVQMNNAEIRGSNGEIIENVTDGEWGFGDADLTGIASATLGVTGGNDILYINSNIRGDFVTSAAQDTIGTEECVYFEQTANEAVYLPASPTLGDTFRIKFTHASGGTLNGNGKNIDGSATLSPAENDAYMVVYNGTEWGIW